MYTVCMDMKKAIKALQVTPETVLFVDIDQVDIRSIERCQAIPKGTLIVGVVGTPNVEAMTVGELEHILAQKRRAVERAKSKEPR